MLCGPAESDVAVLIGGDVSCGPGKTARVVVADRRAAEICGGPLSEAARGLSPPDAVRVVDWRGVVFYGAEQLYIVLRELRRLLERSGLLYTTPPLTRDEILRYRPSRGAIRGPDRQGR